MPDETDYDFDVVGLDDLAQATYRLVLAEGAATADQVADALDVTGSDATATLAHLRAQGLVSRAAAGEHYAAADPRLALRALTDRTASRLDTVRAAIPELAELFEHAANETGTHPSIRTIADPDQIGAWYTRLQHEVEDEFLAWDRPPYVVAGENPVEPMALQRGVDWRVVYATEVLDQPGAWDSMRHAESVGERARIAPTLPTKLVIADRRIAMVSTSLEPAAALVVEARPLVDLLCLVFESVWAQAVAIPPVDRLDDVVDTPRPSETDLQMLALFAVGAKDSVIARELGISDRTLRRRNADLLQRLGAANRFQAGAAAARRGWI